MTTLSLVGVLDDGSPFQPGVPQNTARTLAFPVGGSVKLKVRVLKPTGEVVKTGDLVLTIKKNASDYDYVVKQSVTMAEEVVFTITPQQTKQYAPGRYVYDLWVVNGAQRDQVVPLSAIDLQPVSGLP